MNEHIRPDYENPMSKNGDTICVFPLSTCISCGNTKIFHLCPDCDRTIIAARQARLEKGLNKARKSLTIRQKTTATEVYLKDLWAQRELQEYDNVRGILRNSVILGFGVAIPMIVIGLNMTIENTIRPLGIAMLLGGLAALSSAIHFRITHDNIRMAKQWMELSSKEKTQLIENELLQMHLSQQSGADKPVLPRRMDTLEEVY